MNIFIIILIIFHFFIVLPLFRSLVITTFDEQTLEEYFFPAQDKYSEYWSTEDQYSGRRLYKICHELRKSKIFQIKGKETWVRESSKIDHKISTDLLEKEKNHTITFGFRDKPTLRIGTRNISNISSFNCMDHFGEFNWYITTAFIPDTAFLFTLRPNFFNIFSREIRGHVKKSEIIPKLAAIIDESARPANYNFQRVNELLSYSIKIADEESFGAEKLCHIPHNLKIRLCSIAADFLHADELNRTEFNDPSILPQTYRIRSLNFHIEPENRRNKCQHIELNYHNRVFKHTFLICRISIENSTQFLFMSLNLADRTQAFVGQIRRTAGGEADFRIMNVPLLLHLQEFIRVSNEILT